MTPTSVSSDTVEDPDAPPETSHRRSSDPSWETPQPRTKRLPEFIHLKLEQKEWIRRIIPTLDRAGLSNEQAFFILSAILEENGVDLSTVILSPSTIGSLRTETHLKNEEKIKVTDGSYSLSCNFLFGSLV